MGNGPDLPQNVMGSSFSHGPSLLEDGVKWVSLRNEQTKQTWVKT